MRLFLAAIALAACSSPSAETDAGTDGAVDVFVNDVITTDAIDDAPSDVAEAGDGALTCTLPSDCATHVCLQNGTCANASDVAYVDNANGACTGAHTGTMQDPYCTIVEGLVKSIVYVAGSSAVYAGVAPTTNVWLVGPRNVLPSAKISGASPLVNVSGTAQVILDGFEIVGTGASAAVTCSGASASLSILHDRIHDTPTAVTSTLCTLTIDATQIGPNNTLALSVASGAYSITNSFIVKNGSGATFQAAVSLGGSGTFAFNTIAGNVSFANVPGGLSCSGTQAVRGSIIVQNTKQQLAGQVTGCTFTYCDIDDTLGHAGTGNRSVEPTFVNTANADYHLTTPNACCIDQIPTDTVDHDFDGRARPVNVMWDIGAHEHP